jgi:dihydrofolate reductase
MSKLKVLSFAVSADGFGAGADQSLENPVGVNGTDLMSWFHPTRTFNKHVLGSDSGETGPDDDIARMGFENIGAWILGRNMFGPIRGPWPDDSWKGWWGDNPPYHVPVFVLTNYPRDSFEMEGGTTFHFVTGGIEEALDQAKHAAAGKDVRLGGGVATIRAYLAAGLVDEMHLAFVPALLGHGEALFSGLDLKALGYDMTRSQTTPNAMHLFIGKR